MKINLANFMFTKEPTLLAESGEFKAVAFRYSSGVEALKVSNKRGSFTILPWMGQAIWRCDFDGVELAMKSIYDEPAACKVSYSESYGFFMMHCGLTAMGNPTAQDTHIGHAELPVAKYQEAYLEVGPDYMAVGGTYNHHLCFNYNYLFSPKVTLKAGEAKIGIEVTGTNLKDIPFEYYYLCHINHRPVNGSKIVESPLKCKPIINREVPEDYYKPWADATNKFLDMLEQDYRVQQTIGVKGESYRPEIVNCYFHKPDRQGWAFVRQAYPKKQGKVAGVFVRFRPDELPYATRWIARTKDEDALGMVLPATCEHKGRLFAKSQHEERVLAPGKSFTFHMETGVF